MNYLLLNVLIKTTFGNRTRDSLDYFHAGPSATQSSSRNNPTLQKVPQSIIEPDSSSLHKSDRNHLRKAEGIKVLAVDQVRLVINRIRSGVHILDGKPRLTQFIRQGFHGGFSHLTTVNYALIGLGSSLRINHLPKVHRNPPDSHRLVPTVEKLDVEDHRLILGYHLVHGTGLNAQMPCIGQDNRCSSHRLARTCRKKQCYRRKEKRQRFQPGISQLCLLWEHAVLHPTTARHSSIKHLHESKQILWAEFENIRKDKSFCY